MVFPDHNHLFEEERAGCFTLSFCCRLTVGVLFVFLAVLLVGLQCVNVIFLDHAHLFITIQLVGTLDLLGVLWHFLTVPLVDLLCVIVTFPGHTHLFGISL